MAMEETKKTDTNPELTNEQLVKFNQMLQQKCLQLEQSINQLNNVFTRLNYLFNVLDRAQYFNEDFINACATEIQEILDTRNNTEE